MKKIIGLVLALCLVFSLAAGAFADSKPTITQQPETSTTSKLREPSAPIPGISLTPPPGKRFPAKS